MMGILFAAGASLTGALGSLFLKRGAKPFNILLLGAGFVCFVASTILFVYGLKTQPLSALYPVMGLMYVWSMLLGKIVLKEKVTRSQILGMVLILVGLVLVVGRF